MMFPILQGKLNTKLYNLFKMFGNISEVCYLLKSLQNDLIILANVYRYNFIHISIPTVSWKNPFILEVSSDFFYKGLKTLYDFGISEANISSDAIEYGKASVRISSDDKIVYEYVTHRQDSPHEYKISYGGLRFAYAANSITKDYAFKVSTNDFLTSLDSEKKIGYIVIFNNMMYFIDKSESIVHKLKLSRQFGQLRRPVILDHDPMLSKFLQSLPKRPPLDVLYACGTGYFTARIFADDVKFMLALSEVSDQDRRRAIIELIEKELGTKIDDPFSSDMEQLNKILAQAEEIAHQIYSPLVSPNSIYVMVDGNEATLMISIIRDNSEHTITFKHRSIDDISNILNSPRLIVTYPKPINISLSRIVYPVDVLKLHKCIQNVIKEKRLPNKYVASITYTYDYSRVLVTIYYNGVPIVMDLQLTELYHTNHMIDELSITIDNASHYKIQRYTLMSVLTRENVDDVYKLIEKKLSGAVDSVEEEVKKREAKKRLPPKEEVKIQLPPKEEVKKEEAKEPKKVEIKEVREPPKEVKKVEEPKKEVKKVEEPVKKEEIEKLIQEIKYGKIIEQLRTILKSDYVNFINQGYFPVAALIDFIHSRLHPIRPSVDVLKALDILRDAGYDKEKIELLTIIFKIAMSKSKLT